MLALWKGNNAVRTKAVRVVSFVFNCAIGIALSFLFGTAQSSVTSKGFSRCEINGGSSYSTSVNLQFGINFGSVEYHPQVSIFIMVVGVVYGVGFSRIYEVANDTPSFLRYVLLLIVLALGFGSVFAGSLYYTEERGTAENAGDGSDPRGTLF